MHRAGTLRIMVLSSLSRLSQVSAPLEYAMFSAMGEWSRACQFGCRGLPYHAQAIEQSLADTQDLLLLGMLLMPADRKRRRCPQRMVE